ncbi:hypothetical protein ACN469_41250 [Corallococcus terminator]
MSVGSASSRGNSVSDKEAAARRAAEEARRAAEAARRAAEAARKAAEARQAQESSRKTDTSFEGQSRRPEFDKRLGAEAPATSLLTENAQDGQVNCLEVAADWAKKATPELRARSQMVFLEDQRPGAEGTSGHVVIRQGDKVLDPTTNKSYESMEAFKQAQPHYQEAGSLSTNHVKTILDAPPGSPERAAAIARAKVSPELQRMMVADNPTNPRVAERRLADPRLEKTKTAQKDATAQNVRDAQGQTCPTKSAAEHLQSALEGPLSPEEKKALIQELGPELQRMGNEALAAAPHEAGPMLRALGLASQVGGPGTAKILSDALAKGYPADGLSEPMKSMLGGLVDKPGVTELGTLLAKSRSANGDLIGAAQLGKTLTEGIRTVREDFKDKKEKVDELNKTLAKFMGGLSNGLTPEQRQNAILDFKSRHPEYAAFETAAQKLQGVLDAASTTRDRDSIRDPNAPVSKWEATLTQETSAAIEQAPHIIDTEAGQKWLAQEVDKQIQGLPSPALDTIQSMAKDGKLATDVLTKLTAAATKVVGERVLSSAAKGDTEGAKRLLDTLDQNHALFGATAEEMKGITAGLQDVIDGKPDAHKNLQLLSGGLAGGAPGVVQSIRGLGMACTFVQLAQHGGELTDKQLEDHVKAAGDGLALTGDGATFFLQMTGRGANIPALLGRLSGAGNAMGAIADGIKGVKDIQDKEYLKGAFGLTSSAGGLGLAASGVMAIPGWGQAIAGLAFVTGAVGGYVLEKMEEGEQKNDVKKSLEAAGLKDPALSALLDSDEKTLKELREDMGYSPEQVQQLASKYPSLITHSSQALNNLTDLAKAHGFTAKDLVGMLDSFTQGSKDPSRDLDNLVLRLNQAGPLKTREQWEQFFAVTGQSEALKDRVANLRHHLSVPPAP